MMAVSQGTEIIKRANTSFLLASRTLGERERGPDEQNAHPNNKHRHFISIRPFPSIIHVRLWLSHGTNNNNFRIKPKRNDTTYSYAIARSLNRSSKGIRNVQPQTHVSL